MIGLAIFVAWAYALSLVVTWERERGLGANLIVGGVLAGFALVGCALVAYIEAHVQWVP